MPQRKASGTSTLAEDEAGRLIVPTFLLENAPEGPLKPRERDGLLEIVERRRWVLICLAAPGPIILAVSVLTPGLVRPAILVCLVVFVVSVARHSFARCPRCGDFFNWLNPITMECVSCGLSLDRLSVDGESKSDPERTQSPSETESSRDRPGRTNTDPGTGA